MRSIAGHALIGAAFGLVILGIGGRVIMRVIAHWEGRVPGFSLGGTVTVVFMGAMAGLAGGAVLGILRRFVPNALFRNAFFLLVCVGFTWHAVNALLPRPQLLFVALTLAYVAAMVLVTSRTWPARGSPES